MAAALGGNVSVSKKTLKYVVLGHISSAFVLFGLLFISLNGVAQLDLTLHPFICIKLLTASSLIIHGCLELCLGVNSWQKCRMNVWLKDGFKCLLIFLLSILFFHCIAVLFGAQFSQKTAETFHFAMALSSTTIAPLLIHLSTDFDAWMRIIIYQSPEVGIETIVYVSSITSVLGAWLGAFPIPLDWDRPWQVWPITCVVGSFVGHCLGMILSAVYTSIQFNKGNKYKLT